MSNVFPIDRAQIPLLIAQFLPVEICVYYQVVPIAKEGDTLILGMVDPEDLAALDYVGKMLAYSRLHIEARPLDPDEQQDLIAYFFSHPPDASELEALRESSRQHPPQTIAAPLPLAVPEPEDPPERPRTAQPTPALDEASEETVQQILNSMLRRALDEQADQIFIDAQDNNTYRVRYRQQGILRDLFKQLSDTVGGRLLANLKKMLGLDPDLLGEPQLAEVERIFRKEPLILQLKIIPQRNKEGAILSLLRGEVFRRFQQNQHNQRVQEVTGTIQAAQETLQSLHTLLASTIDKARQYPGIPNEDWYALADQLDALKAQQQLIEIAQQDWLGILKDDDNIS